ncbi:MAG: class I SAM-dependent methyltransferase [Aestuariivirga sp.]
MKCRHCGHVGGHPVIDLGHAPPSNAYLSRDDLKKPEITYPLAVKVCGNCFLVQTEDYAKADELFTSDYAYFSSTSKSWLDHAAHYAKNISARLSLGPQSLVIEVASNDGYLLRNFVDAKIPCLGIEPTASTAAAAEKLGIPVLHKFFGQDLAKQLVADDKQADLVCGNNVYAHVPDINDFTSGLATVLKPQGVVTLEFPHLLNLIRLCQFDTIYHEHYSYLSLAVVQRIFAKAGLRLFDVEELETHGGSLRIYGCRQDAKHIRTENVQRILIAEQTAGLESVETYSSFQSRAEKIKLNFLSFLIDAKQRGKKVVAYGAAAKGNTLLNFAGVKPDLLPVVFDAATAKQGKLMPGSHIPILPPDALAKSTADYVVILPWNIAAEVMERTKALVAARARYVVAVPELKIL